MGNFAFGYENVVEAYELLKNYIVHVHCKDRSSEGSGLLSVPTGSGYIPIAQLVRKLNAAGYRGYLSIEHFGDLDQLASIEQITVGTQTNYTSINAIDTKAILFRQNILYNNRRIVETISTYYAKVAGAFIFPRNEVPAICILHIYTSSRKNGPPV